MRGGGGGGPPLWGGGIKRGGGGGGGGHAMYLSIAMDGQPAAGHYTHSGKKNLMSVSVDEHGPHMDGQCLASCTNGVVPALAFLCSLE